MATTTYPYSPLVLGPNSIRLLHIQKGWGPDDVVCQLFESFPDQGRGPAYKALSYTWGGLQHRFQGGEPRVLIDGYHIKMKENLYTALRQIRCHDRDVTLWVDAICINQEDKAEKGHQVSQMGNVYKGAEEVLIWLGLSNEDIDSLLKSISCIDAKAIEAQALSSTEDWRSLCRRFFDQRLLGLGPPTQSKTTQALANLLARPWFTRVWVLQEVANARTARIMCGSRSCPARTFALIPSFMGLDINEHTRAVLDIMPRVRQNTWWSSKRYLQFLLNKFAKSQACMPRDKIYALLGMSEDACDPKRFHPCYLKSNGEVFRDTASFLLFGEILDSSFSLPEFALADLSLPIIQLAEKTLSWALGQSGLQPDSVRKTAELLIRRLNEGQLKTADMLLTLVERHAPLQLDKVRDIFRQGQVELGVNFEDTGATLTIASKHDSLIAPVSLAFSREVSPSRDSRSMPPPPFKDDENMLETITQLEQAGSSNEELLRAHVWAGHTDIVRRYLGMGVDVDGADSNGFTALHFASRRGYEEIVALLLQKGADVNRKARF
ncbi:heterokaryon incompatibility protein-domain-containing protein [Chaetomium fimeti]|uniref:Heterokaryon incompatibility protein-domain-containing protein n=1 Tax=Chaetomium fimeti TaxID=1854472 RepID=A0AAE0LP73_9PEZI|nr:heterokaryon incompatibility protein-domain-containing protein [Chaetomium fimeti]